MYLKFKKNVTIRDGLLVICVMVHGLRGRGCQGFCNDSTDSTNRRDNMEEGFTKLIENCVTLFIDDT